MALLMQLLEDADIPDPSAGLSLWWSSFDCLRGISLQSAVVSTFFADQ